MEARTLATLEARSLATLITVSLIFGYLVLGDIINRWSGVYPKVQCVVVEAVK